MRNSQYRRVCLKTFKATKLNKSLLEQTTATDIQSDVPEGQSPKRRIL